MTEQEQKVYSATVKRLARMGAKDPTAQIIALAEEIDRYRNKIYQLETGSRTDAPAPPSTPSTRPRYTHYDVGLDRFVIPIDHDRVRGYDIMFRVGMTCSEYPNCVFGAAVDKLAHYENQEEEA